MRPEEKLSAARLWAANRQPYLASALFAMTPRPTPGLGTFGVDRRWRLYVDPATLERWSVEEAGAVLVHEAHHLLRDHPRRAEALGIGDGDHHRFNVAADMEINDDLADLPLPEGGCTPQAAGLEPGDLAESYYAALSGMALPTGWNCGSGAHGHHESWGLPADAADGGGEAEGERIRQHAATEVRAAAARPGSVPAGLARWAEAFLRPTVDWPRLPAGAVRGAVVSVAGAVDYTYSRPSRRAGSPLGRAVVLPALRQPVPRTAVVVDTSASMSQPHLEMALGELRGILQAAGIGGDGVAVLS